MKVYLVRHGKTEWNRDKKFQGQKNSPLLAEGREQARLLGERLRGTSFDGIYCSPLGRTRETAALLEPVGEIIPDDAFMEIDLGRLEGETFADLAPEIKHLVDMFWHHPAEFDKKLTGGEDFNDIRDRAVTRLEELIRLHPEESRLLIISHGALLKSIVNHYEGRGTEDFWEGPFLQPASLTVLSFEKGAFRGVESLGDTSHYA